MSAREENQGGRRAWLRPILFPFVLVLRPIGWRLRSFFVAETLADCVDLRAGEAAMRERLQAVLARLDTLRTQHETLRAGHDELHDRATVLQIRADQNQARLEELLRLMRDPPPAPPSPELAALADTMERALLSLTLASRSGVQPEGSSPSAAQSRAE